MNLSPGAARAIQQGYLEVSLVVASLQAGHVRADQAMAIRAHLEQLLRAERQSLLSSGVAEVWVEAIQMAVVGLIDEAARYAPNRELAHNWESLQFPLYGQENLGVRYFQELSALRANRDTPVEVLEVYARCLALGFKGEYEPDRLSELKIIHEGLRSDILRKLGPPPPLTSHLDPLEKKAGPPPVLGPLWVGVIALSLLALVGVFLTAKLMIDVKSTVTELRGYHEKMVAGDTPGASEGDE